MAFITVPIMRDRGNPFSRCKGALGFSLRHGESKGAFFCGTLGDERQRHFAGILGRVYLRYTRRGYEGIVTSITSGLHAEKGIEDAPHHSLGVSHRPLGDRS